MDIKGSDGDDLIQQAAGDDSWNAYFGLKGNDVIKLYQGNALGGPGNDRIEALPSADWWRQVSAAYWDSPNGVVVDLAAGTAEDGWGTRDTLVGVHNVNGSWHDDRLYGDAFDNVITAGGGHTVTDGRAGDDLVWLPMLREGMTMAEFTVSTSIDARTATVTAAGFPNFKLELSNIERIGIGWQVNQSLADFIQPEQMAREGLLGSNAQRWNASAALGSAKELTFGFVTSAPASGPGATGFAAFTDAQRAAVRAILDGVAQFCGLSFREVAADQADLRFGASAQDATRGVSAMPGQVGAGQVWMDVDSVRDLAPGSEGYAALLHEIGHALGLRHPRNVDAGDAWSAQWREADDLTSYSVMAHTPGADGLVPSAFGALDIVALRTLYGSRAVNGGDTVYALGGLRFSSQTAVVDDGGNDTIDASASANGVVIDLNGGKPSSVGVTPAGQAGVNNLTIAPGSVIENAVGSAGDDVLLGNATDNQLRGGAGNDWLDGGAGTDTAVFEGRRVDYLVSTGFGKVFVKARDGQSGFDTLLNVEKLRFADATVTLGKGALAADLEIELDHDTSVAGQLPAASDGATLIYSVKTAPAHGSLTLTAGGAYVYKPEAGFAAGDRFVFTAKDASGVSNDYVGFVNVLGGTVPAATDGADKLAGTAGDDRLAAGGGDDSIAGSGGADRIDGGAGFDVLRYDGARADYHFVRGADGSFTVAKPGGNTDLLSGVERVQIGGVAVALDLDGAAGQAYRVYQAAFDRTPDAGGLSFWMFSMDHGTSLRDVAQGFMDSDEFRKLYGANPTAEQFVSKLYNNVLHRAPEQAGYDFWVKVVAGGYSRAEVLAQFSESAENVAQLVGVIGNGIDYTPFGT